MLKQTKECISELAVTINFTHVRVYVYVQVCMYVFIYVILLNFAGPFVFREKDVKIV